MMNALFGKGPVGPVRATMAALEAQHRMLDLQIRRLERRGLRMTPPERDQASALKRLKLATKDRLAELTRR